MILPVLIGRLALAKLQERARLLETEVQEFRVREKALEVIIERERAYLKHAEDRVKEARELQVEALSAAMNAQDALRTHKCEVPVPVINIVFPESFAIKLEHSKPPRPAPADDEILEPLSDTIQEACVNYALGSDKAQQLAVNRSHARKMVQDGKSEEEIIDALMAGLQRRQPRVRRTT